VTIAAPAIASRAENGATRLSMTGGLEYRDEIAHKETRADGERHREHRKPAAV
jgi:hypothetical protein